CSHRAASLGRPHSPRAASPPRSPPCVLRRLASPRSASRASPARATSGECGDRLDRTRRRSFGPRAEDECRLCSRRPNAVDAPSRPRASVLTPTSPADRRRGHACRTGRIRGALRAGRPRESRSWFLRSLRFLVGYGSLYDASRQVQTTQAFHNIPELADSSAGGMLALAVLPVCRASYLLHQPASHTAYDGNGVAELVFYRA